MTAHKAVYVPSQTLAEPNWRVLQQIGRYCFGDVSIGLFFIEIFTKSTDDHQSRVIFVFPCSRNTLVQSIDTGYEKGNSDD
jgi:hypothetical protein